eukprot:PRCOL_00003071-RA
MPKPVPESVLKKRKRNEQWAADKLKAKEATRAKAKAARADIFKRAESYVKEYRAQEADLIRLKREARAKGGFYVPDEAKIVFVMRIRGLNDMHPKTKKVLQILRLRQIHNGVFLRVNKPVMNMLRIVEPYITYGYPSLKTVRELIYKRGYGKVGAGKQRIPLTENQIIEKELGEKTEGRIICIEDVIHEIYTAGPHFKQVSNFLWPFKLSAPLGGYTQKRTHYIEGGEAGQREEAINALVRRMN